MFFSFDLFDQLDGVTNVISSRVAGMSGGPFHSLNLGFHVGDDEQAVLENRRRLCTALKVDPESLVTGQQVHGTTVSVVTASDKGRGAVSWTGGLPATDALVTEVPGVPLLVLVADCVALSFCDPKRGVIALAHAGWKGTVGGIAQKTVAKMGESFGCNPFDIVVGVSPSIGPCCYKVGDEVVTALHEAFPEQASRCFVGNHSGSPHLDLWKANAYQLLQAGVTPDHIEVSGICTACNTDRFYSHRAETGRTGRFGGLIVMSPS
ncbi:MAG: peptidoglycan editing factor PgeF [Armatimonadetes bacterium]|nr:peptidoglycan editing factor PgeF [Armatimonadota bacterium]